ncbi:hypothetical protein CDD83_9628 [Cordyceps sp. RAO-2017]|nr:hypothetical protein CDD83_9628 [Cordyceps sp. RAO-2017]
MFARKMAVVSTAFLAVGCFVSGVLSVAPYSNDASTETAAPQELGSMTIDGSLVYSVNMCTIVHSTNCQVSMSTGGAAPPAGPAEGSSGAAAPTVPGEAAPTVPGEGEYGSNVIPATLAYSAVDAASTGPEPASTELEASVPTSMARGNASAYLSASEEAAATPTRSSHYLAATSTSSPTPPTSTGASNTVSVVRGVAIGAGAMAVALLF